MLHRGKENIKHGGSKEMIASDEADNRDYTYE
jgi:hypothetical protein